MEPLRQPLSGFGYLPAGFKLLLRPALWPYLLLPLSINVLVFGLLLWLAADQFGALVDTLLPSLPEWLAWLAWLLWLLFVLVAAMIIFFTFSVVANIIASPFNGLLAEAVERLLTGQAPPPSGSLWQALRETPQAVADELRKLGYYAVWALPLLLLFVIPVVNLAAPLLWALFSAWMLALQYLDYPLGNHGLRFKAQRQRLRSKPMLGLGFGGAVLLATLVPLLNLIVMPAAVAGATRLWVEQLRDGAETGA
jgi:CysZ protein